MKRQKQVEFSKKVISEALFRLLIKYKYEEITVSQITAEAGVARNTFYRNFDSIEDILVYTLNSSLDSALQELTALDSPTIENLIEWRVNFAFEHPYFIHVDSQPFLQLMLQKFTTQHAERLVNLIQAPGDEFDIFKFTYHQHGIQAVIRAWGIGGFKRPKKEIVQLILAQFPGAANGEARP